MFLSSSTPYLSFKFCVVLSHQLHSTSSNLAKAQALMMRLKEAVLTLVLVEPQSQLALQKSMQPVINNLGLLKPAVDGMANEAKQHWRWGIVTDNTCCQWHGKWYLIPQWRWKQGLTIFVTFRRNLPPFEIVAIQVQCAIATQQRLSEAFVSGSYFGRCLEFSLGAGLPWWLSLSAWWQRWKRLLTKLSAICLLHT